MNGNREIPQVSSPDGGDGRAGRLEAARRSCTPVGSRMPA
jgi:hypothetical protein